MNFTYDARIAVGASVLLPGTICLWLWRVETKLWLPLTVGAFVAFLLLLYVVSSKWLDLRSRLALVGVIFLHSWLAFFVEERYPLPMYPQFGALSEIWADQPLFSRSPVHLNFPATSWVFSLPFRLGLDFPWWVWFNSGLLAIALCGLMVFLSNTGIPPRAMWLVPLVGLMPSQIVFSADIGKESLLSAGVIFTLCSAIVLQMRREILSPKWWIMLITGQSLVGIARPSLLLIIAPMIAIATLALSTDRKFWLRNSFPVLLSFALQAWLWLEIQLRMGGWAPRFAVEYAQSALEGSLTEYQKFSPASDSTSMSSSVTPNGPVEALLLVVPRSVALLLGPAGSKGPWNIENLSRVDQLISVTQFGTAVLLALAAPGLVLFARISLHRKYSIALALLLASIACLCGIALSTTLIVPRYASPIDSVLLSLALLGLGLAKPRQRVIAIISGVVLLGAVLLGSDWLRLRL